MFDLNTPTLMPIYLLKAKQKNDLLNETPNKNLNVKYRINQYFLLVSTI